MDFLITKCITIENLALAIATKPIKFGGNKSVSPRKLLCNIFVKISKNINPP